MFKYHTEIHIPIYEFINFLMKQYDDFKDSMYPYSRWEDALYDYMNVTRLEIDTSHALRKPNNLTPHSFINNYLTDIFYNYFPNKDVIYLDD